jgi:MAP/microtubule affinity-regulating kinase
MNNTSSKEAEELLTEMKRVLVSNDIMFEHSEPFMLLCEHGEVTFEMEICKLPRLMMNGIRHKRIGGPSLAYKNICTKLLNEMNM